MRPSPQNGSELPVRADIQLQGASSSSKRGVPHPSPPPVRPYPTGHPDPPAGASPLPSPSPLQGQGRRGAVTPGEAPAAPLVPRSPVSHFRGPHRPPPAGERRG